MNPVVFLFGVGIVGNVVGWSIGLGLYLSSKREQHIVQPPHYRRLNRPQFARLTFEQIR